MFKKEIETFKSLSAKFDGAAGDQDKEMDVAEEFFGQLSNDETIRIYNSAKLAVRSSATQHRHTAVTNVPHDESTTMNDGGTR